MAKTRLLQLITGLFLCATLHGCYILNDLLVEETVPELSLQQKCEKSVTDYINDRLDNEAYRAYGFSDVIIHKPIEILELEELEEQRTSGKKTGPGIDSLIEYQRNYIRANEIKRTVEISHFFTLKKPNGPVAVLESNYLLNDTLAVIDFSPEIILDMPREYEEALNYYFYEYGLFQTSSYSDSRNLTNQFYTFFKSRQKELMGVQSKSGFLLHTLKITGIVKENAAFDQNLIAKTLLHEMLSSGPGAVTDYAALEFSPLYEKRTDDLVSGYYIFHKFRGHLHDTTATYIYRADFSPWYEVQSLTEMPEPFESYLNK